MDSFYTQQELMKIGFKHVGKNVLISRNAGIYGAHNMSIGNHVRIDDFCILSGKIHLENYIHIAAYSALYGGNKGITISEFANISSRVTIYSVSDDYSGATMTNPMVPDKFKNVESKPVRIEKHVIIGSTSVVLPGSVLREGCSFGAFSLIKGEYAEWNIYAGIPAKHIKKRKKDLLLLEKQFFEEENQ